MLKQIKIGFLAVVLAGSLFSCKNDEATGDATAAAGTEAAAATDATATPQQTPGQITNVNPTTTDVQQPAAPTGPTTAIAFSESEFNFGKVKAGEKVQHDYKFKNTGKEPLVISDAKGSCGCTVPEWPKEPIPPGGSGVIKVQFDSKGKSGSQTKQVTITANTDPVQTIIQIKGEVTPDPNAAAPTAAPTGK